MKRLLLAAAAVVITIGALDQVRREHITPPVSPPMSDTEQRILCERLWRQAFEHNGSLDLWRAAKCKGR